MWCLKRRGYVRRKISLLSLCSVNLSVQTLLSPDWQPWLLQLLASGQLKSGQFAFELDEYHLLKQYQALKPKLQQLHQLGFRLIVGSCWLID